MSSQTIRFTEFSSLADLDAVLSGRKVPAPAHVQARYDAAVASGDLFAILTMSAEFPQYSFGDEEPTAREQVLVESAAARIPCTRCRGAGRLGAYHHVAGATRLMQAIAAQPTSILV